MAENQPKPARNFRVEHTLVGPFEQGRIVTESQLNQVGDGVNLQRLIDLGAITQIAEPATQTPVPLGPENPGGGTLDASAPTAPTEPPPEPSEPPPPTPTPGTGTRRTR